MENPMENPGRYGNFGGDWWIQLCSLPFTDNHFWIEKTMVNCQPSPPMNSYSVGSKHCLQKMLLLKPPSPPSHHPFQRLGIIRCSLTAQQPSGSYTTLFRHIFHARKKSKTFEAQHGFYMTKAVENPLEGLFF